MALYSPAVANKNQKIMKGYQNAPQKILSEFLTGDIINLQLNTQK